MNKTFQKVLAVILCLATLSSLCVFSASAAAGKDLMVATKGKITVDGTFTVSKNNDEMINPDVLIGQDLYAGASWWDDGNLYLTVAGYGIGLQKLVLTVGGLDLTLEKGKEAQASVLYKFGQKKGSSVRFAEVAIPLEKLQFERTGNEVRTALTLAVTATNGSGNFDGAIVFTADETFRNHTVLGKNASDGSDHRYGKGTVDKEVVTLTNAQDVYNETFTMRDNLGEYVFKIHLNVKEMESLADLSAVKPEDNNIKKNPSRFLLKISQGSKQAADRADWFFFVAIYNVNGELTLVRTKNGNGLDTPVKLGKGLNEDFALGLQWNKNHSFDVTVDGVKVGTVPAYTAGTPWYGRQWSTKTWGVIMDATNGSSTPATPTTVTYHSLSFSKHQAFDADAFLKLATTKKVGYYGNQETAVENGTYRIRFVSTVDSLDYASAGFEVTAKYTVNGVEKTTQLKDVNLTTAYSSLLAGTEAVKAPDGKWFVAFVLNNVPTSYGTVTFTLKPYVIETEGEAKIYADSVTVTYGADGKPVA